MAYSVSLKQYEYTGPLDMLIDMITRAKIDIRDIFLSEITEQYLESMSQIGDLDMDSASEFLQMAATLLEIKSRALLPEPPKEEQDEESLEDALIRQLTEYKQFKELSQEMKRLEAEAKALITKLPEEYPLPPPTIELTGLTLAGLTRAFSRVLRRLNAQTQSDIFDDFSRREIRREQYTVAQCMISIMARLKKRALKFDELFKGVPTRDEIITVFLALLELIKLNRAQAIQEDPFGEITITARKSQPEQNEPTT